jgi:hypothetical protein
MRLFLLLPLIVVLAACGSDPEDPARTATVGEADVERFRAEVFLQTVPLDAEIARLEGEIAALDSVRQAAYAPLLETLHARRRSLQLRVDTLAPLPRAAFDTTRAELLEQVARLHRVVERAPLMGAPDAEVLRTASDRILREVETGADALRAIARADTTGGLQRGLDSLAAERGRLQTRLRTYADTSEALFAPFRQEVTRAAFGLRERLRALRPDSLDAAPSPAP